MNSISFWSRDGKHVGDSHIEDEEQFLIVLNEALLVLAGGLYGSDTPTTRFMREQKIHKIEVHTADDLQDPSRDPLVVTKHACLVQFRTSIPT